MNHRLFHLLKVDRLKKNTKFLAASSILFCSNFLPVYGESPFLRKGIEAYTAGDFSKAAGDFGAAESAEFNNPVMHYYLANTLAQLKDRDGAIREYRIAYAIDPDGDVGRQCRLALSVYGADMFGSKPKRNSKDPTTSFGKITFSSDPVIQQAVLSMHKQVDQLTSDYIYNNISPTANNGNPRNMNVLRRAYRQLAQDNINSASAAAESAHNLEKLLNNNSSRSAVKLDPVGTNLYIRKYNYSDPNDQLQRSSTVNGKLINKTSTSSGKE